MRRSVVILAATLSSVATAVRAQRVDAAAADSRCLVAMVALSSHAPSPQMAMIGKLGVAYYAGRIRTEDPDFDLTKELTRLAAGLSQPVLQAEAARCGPPVLQMLQQVSAAFPPKKAPAAPRPPGAPSGRKGPSSGVASSTDYRTG